ncbi:hypothetical protein FGO68_gene1317 [Halteria grandinella]|uniref:Uncharacterized protein n=1 Tax=Halteria grandinella TaxID=5974 RepID=A0A8J8NQV7_HALGN|nr:hypothetical protein FGO68_gene1317 [Halteria grandinella]
MLQQQQKVFANSVLATMLPLQIIGFNSYFCLSLQYPSLFIQQIWLNRFQLYKKHQLEKSKYFVRYMPFQTAFVQFMQSDTFQGVPPIDQNRQLLVFVVVLGNLQFLPQGSLSWYTISALSFCFELFLSDKSPYFPAQWCS